MKKILRGTVRAGVRVIGHLRCAPFMPARKYEGPYEITPALTGRVLGTSGRLMTENVTVAPIPISRTVAPAGGVTVIIG